MQSAPSIDSESVAPLPGSSAASSIKSYRSPPVSDAPTLSDATIPSSFIEILAPLISESARTSALTIIAIVSSAETSAASKSPVAKSKNGRKFMPVLFFGFAVSLSASRASSSLTLR